MSQRQHEPQLITKKARIGGPAGPEGFLVVSTASLQWQPAGGDAGGPGIGTLRINLARITGTQQAKGKPLVRLTVGSEGGQQHHVFQFETVADRDAALDVITKMMQQQAATGGSGAPRAGGGGGGTIAGFTGPQRDQLLNKDPDLRALHEELVGGGAISEEDFWRGMAARGVTATGAPAASGTAAAAPAVGAVPAGSKHRPRVGLSNILQRVDAEIDGRHGRVLKVRLTEEQVAQVFAEKPHVLRAYRENVPHRMDVEDFWKRYVKYEMHKESKRKARLLKASSSAAPAGPLGDDAGGDIFREAARAQAEEDAARVHAVSRRRGGTDPTLDLAADMAEQYTGHGLAHGYNKDPDMAMAQHLVLRSAALQREQAGGHSLNDELLLRHAAGDGEEDSLAYDINRHGAVVLQGVSALDAAEAQLSGGRGGAGHHGHHHHAHHHHAGGKHKQQQQGSSDGSDERAPQRRRYSAGLDDLHAPQQAAFEQLSIADPRRYFDRMAGGDAAAAAGTNGMPHPAQRPRPAGGLQGLFGDVDPGSLPLPPVSATAAAAALLEATPLAMREAAARDEEPGVAVLSAAAAAGAGSGDPAARLPPELLAVLRRTCLSVQEACHHFWEVMPANSPARRDKALRLVKLLEAKRAELDLMNDNARGSEGRPVRQLLKPLTDMLLTALVRWDEEARRARVAH